MHNLRSSAATGLPTSALSTGLKTPRDELFTIQIEADHCPQVLLRVLGLMTRDGTIPVTVAVRRTEEAILIAVELDGATAERCARLKDRIEEVPTVRKASVSSGPTVRPAGASKI